MKIQPNSPILKQGCRMKEDDTSWINWYVYRPDYPIEALEEEFQIYTSLLPGQVYSKKPTVRVSSTKILVKQLIGLEIAKNTQILGMLKPKHGKGDNAMKEKPTRTEMIDFLYNFYAENNSLDDYILNGFKGLNDRTDEELLEQWKDLHEEGI